MHKQNRSRFFITMSALIGAILIAIYIHITNGTFDMSVKDIVTTLLRMNPTNDFDLVIFEFRLPRIVIAALVGLGLGIAGTVVQGITRNGLADPGILGINAGAGASIVIFMFFFQMELAVSGSSNWLSIIIMPIFGFVGGLIAAILIYIFSWTNGKLDTQRLILSGIAISTGFGALSLYISLKMRESDFEMATVWMSGSIYNANWIFILAMIPWLLILVPIIYRKAYLLDYFQLEESSIKSLGIQVEKEKAILLLSSIGVISACVSVSGSIGFIGLIAPHIAKQLVGIHHRYVLPASAAIGMFLVIFSDYLAKTIFAPAEIPVGIIVAILGVPYFLYLLMKTKA